MSGARDDTESGQQIDVRRPWFVFDRASTQQNKWLPAPSLAFCVPANPVTTSLRLRAQMNLFKLRHCRNIAGLERELEPYAARTDIGNDLPQVGGDGQLILGGVVGVPPTAYHYSYLIERAKQLGQMAAQFEGNMLSALERRDAEAYTVLRARQDAELLHSQLRMQDLRVNEAQGGVDAAQLQVGRTDVEISHWTEYLREPVSDLEEQSIFLSSVAASLYGGAAIASMAAAATPSADTVVGFGASNENSLASALSAAGQAAATTAQIKSQTASYERRAMDWRFSQQLAMKDRQIANQAVTNAQIALMVSREERVIAGLAYDHAVTGVEFLTNKFTNAELYDWMSTVWEQVYRWFLLQATATARLAADQLGFQLQEIPPPYVQPDYWQPPTNTDGQPVDRHGLTGSARLLQDIYQLDQHAFLKNVRKLQLTKTISLSQLAPVEMQRFRQTGVLPFATTLEMFDRDFPGHYLRLINKVRVSVLALIPPSQGIRATLASTGSSRAIAGGGNGPLQTVVIRRDPQLVALSAAANATGVFDLDPQAELVLPFEGLGVETHWELRMPKAANPFDFNTVADVLFTIEYTALHNYEYAAQVMNTLGREMSYDRAYSFARDLPDAWLGLHNPAPATPLTVRFRTTRVDYAPNLDDLRIQHVTMSFVIPDGPPLTVTINHLRLTPAGNGRWRRRIDDRRNTQHPPRQRQLVPTTR